jgi:hypothetical protein
MSRNCDFSNILAEYIVKRQFGSRKNCLDVLEANKPSKITNPSSKSQQDIPNSFSPKNQLKSKLNDSYCKTRKQNYVPS